MKDWCPFCGKPCEVDEVDLSQYDHDVIKKFLDKPRPQYKEAYTKDFSWKEVIETLKDELEEGN